MLALNNKLVSLLVGGMVAAAFVLHAPRAWHNLSVLHDRQVESNERFYDWRDAYEAHLPVNAEWMRTYSSAVKDLVELYQKLNLEQHGLTADIDKVMQTGVRKVDVQGFDVGLSSLCVGTGHGQSVRLVSTSFAELRQGVEALAERKDIEMGSLEFAYDRSTSKPYVQVSGLCLRVRSDESASADMPSI